jgi:iron complex outermembrane receptor protein
MTMMRNLKFITFFYLANPPFNRRNRVLAAALAACLPGVSAGAETQEAIQFNIPAQDLSRALSVFTTQSHVQVLYEGNIAQGLRSTPLKGSYTPNKALKMLLTGIPVQARFTSERTATLEHKASSTYSSSDSNDTVALDTVTVRAESNDDADSTAYNRTSATTATKTDTPIMETPMSIQVVPKQVLQDQQAYRIQDAVKNVSGVQQYSTNGGTFGGDSTFVVRGFELDNVRYRNGVRVSGRNAISNVTDFANLERIEVLKGPASGLYGRIEPGGLINTVTKKASTVPYYSVEQRFGSYDHYRTEANATGALTNDGSLAYRLDLSYLDTNSFRDDVFNDRVFVAPSVTWKPLERTEFNLSFEYLDEDRTYDSGIPLVNGRFASVPISRTVTQKGSADRGSSWLVDFNWTHEFNDYLKLRNGVLASDGTSSMQEIYANGAADANGNVDRGGWLGSLANDQQTVYLDLTGKFETFGVKHTALIGGDYYHQSRDVLATSRVIDRINVFTTARPYIDLKAADVPPYGFSAVQTDEWYGVYFQDEMTLWDQLHIMGGGRYDMATFGSGFSDQNLPEARALYSDIEENHFSPRVGVLYQPLQWLSLYGHFVESFGTNNGRQQSGKPFAPQIATEYEGGIKTSFFDGRLTGTLAYYHLTKQNVLTTDPNNPNLSVAIGEARSQGLEADFSGRLTDGLNAIVTYAYTDTAITKDNSGNQGNRLPYVPAHAGSFWLKYDFQEEFLHGFSVGAGVYTADKRYGDAANSYSDGAYARLDLMAAYRFKVGPTRLTTQLNINNVAGTKYWVPRASWSNVPAEPLMAFGSVRLEF